jgi:hypothetical protein
MRLGVERIQWRWSPAAMDWTSSTQTTSVTGGVLLARANRKWCHGPAGHGLADVRIHNPGIMRVSVVPVNGGSRGGQSVSTVQPLSWWLWHRVRPPKKSPPGTVLAFALPRGEALHVGSSCRGRASRCRGGTISSSICPCHTLAAHGTWHPVPGPPMCDWASSLAAFTLDGFPCFSRRAVSSVI